MGLIIDRDLRDRLGGQVEDEASVRADELHTLLSEDHAIDMSETPRGVYALVVTAVCEDHDDGV